jgi:hypothetical protein
MKILIISVEKGSLLERCRSIKESERVGEGVCVREREAVIFCRIDSRRLSVCWRWESQYLYLHVFSKFELMI